jgi:hypothetical protein
MPFFVRIATAKHEQLPVQRLTTLFGTKIETNAVIYQTRAP